MVNEPFLRDMRRTWHLLVQHSQCCYQTYGKLTARDLLLGAGDKTPSFLPMSISLLWMTKLPLANDINRRLKYICEVYYSIR